MMFIVRTAGASRPDLEGKIVLVRRTPPQVSAGADQTDLFCVGPDDAPEQLRAQGWLVVAVHDGWYADDRAGGIAVWGQGRYWELRETPFEITRRGD